MLGLGSPAQAEPLSAIPHLLVTVDDGQIVIAGEVRGSPGLTAEGRLSVESHSQGNSMKSNQSSPFTLSEDGLARVGLIRIRKTEETELTAELEILKEGNVIGRTILELGADPGDDDN